MRRLLIALTLILATPAWAEEIVIENAYARTARPGAPTGAVFMVLRNTGATADRLIAAESPVAELVQLHTHTETDGVMRMRQIEGGIDLPPGARHELARGGDHVMLMGVTEALKDGDTLPLTLVFEVAGNVVLEVPIDSARGQAGSAEP